MNCEKLNMHNCTNIEPWEHKHLYSLRQRPHYLLMKDWEQEKSDGILHNVVLLKSNSYLDLPLQGNKVLSWCRKAANPITFSGWNLTEFGKRRGTRYPPSSRKLKIPYHTGGRQEHREKLALKTEIHELHKSEAEWEKCRKLSCSSPPRLTRTRSQARADDP